MRNKSRVAEIDWPRLRSRLGLFAIGALGLALVQAQASELVLHNFGTPPRGENPTTGVVRDSAGNLYGTTATGGVDGAGVVYKVDTSGHQTVLYSFTGGVDGGYPYSGVILDSAGNLYGTASSGGAAYQGVVYQLDTSGHETVLYNFTGGVDGGSPRSDLFRDGAGNLYGITPSGGNGFGVVYKVDKTGHETVLYSFMGAADGGYPNAGVIADPSGNLYGTANSGGTSGAGVVYKLDKTGHETVLYNFTGGADGAYPNAGVIRDPAGNLYGCTSSGGDMGYGVVYKLDSTGHQKVLHSFSYWPDGAYPSPGLIGDSAGNLYGTASVGGTGGGGVVYKLDRTGQETVLYNFTDGADGGYPDAGVIRDSAGNFYGTTAGGGVARLGLVFKLDAAGNETPLFSFAGGIDGYDSWAGVAADSAGNLYGATNSGGPMNLGVVYKLDTTGHETILHSFTGGADGSNPNSVIVDQAGNLYGTTANGGSNGYGVVYKLDAAGQLTVLYSFTGGTDGYNPAAGVIRDTAGNLYGTALGGGTGGYGVVFKVDPSGHETVLYNFTGGTDGAQPYAGVIRDSAGNLYGTAASGGTSGSGVVYKLDRTGHQTVLYSFAGGADGCSPQAGLVRDSAGNLYGTTPMCGSAYAGTVYKVDAAGNETVLHSFTFSDGAWPNRGSLIRDSAGNLYGSAPVGGPIGGGVVYMVDPSGNETVLYGFTGGADGGNPQSGLLRDSKGNLYGTTASGGTKTGGVIFKLTP